MLRIKDNHILFARGESVCPEFQIVMNYGRPFIMPPLDNSQSDKSAILAFTVKSGISDDIVLAKYLNLLDTPIYAGYIDLSSNGYCKFLSQEPLVFNDISDIYDAYGFSPNNSGENTIETPTNTQLINRKYVAYCQSTDKYYCWVQTGVNGKVVAYTFEFQIPIFPEETQNLDTKEYVYDLCVYIGKLKDEFEDKEFPLETIDWKLQLLRQHKLILEDSNNV